MFMNTEIPDLIDENDFRVRFGGDLHEIDSNTLVNYLLHLNTIITEVNRELEPERKIKVKIKALEKGSFEVLVQIQSIIEQIKGLFSADDAGYVANIITIVSGLYALRLFLKGKKPDEVSRDKPNNSVTITNSDGNQVTINYNTYHIYESNKPINQAITKQFETLDADPNIESISITNRDNVDLVSVSHNEFSEIATPNEQLETPISHEIREKVILSIVKISFDPKLVCDFIYMGIRISAYIKDKDFYERVDRGEAFAKGDALEAKLQVNKQFEPTLNTDVIKNYEVLQVIRHIPRNDPGQLVLEL
ncbi:hypothetical protein GCM10028818_01110 [Spirosoma horti]